MRSIFARCHGPHTQRWSRYSSEIHLPNSLPNFQRINLNKVLGKRTLIGILIIILIQQLASHCSYVRSVYLNNDAIRVTKHVYK